MILYKEFIQLVPDTTKQCIDEFLKNFDKTSLSEKNEDIFSLSFLEYMIQNNKQVRSYINKKYPNLINNESYNTNQEYKNNNIEEIFNEYASIFNFSEKHSHYGYLTPESLFFHILHSKSEVFFSYDNKELYNKLIELIPDYNKNKYAEDILFINQEIMDNIPLKNIEFFKKVLLIHDDLLHEESITSEQLYIILLISMFECKNYEYISYYLENKNITKENVIDGVNKLKTFENDIKLDDLNSLISNLDSVTIDRKPIAILKCYYSKYLQMNIEDILKDILKSDNKIIQNVININDIFKEIDGIDERLNFYKQNEQKIKIKRYQNMIYNNHNQLICTYINLISKYFRMLKEKNDNYELSITFDNYEILLQVAKLLLIFKNDNKISETNNIKLFLEHNGITLEKCLDYFSLKQEDLDVLDKEIDYDSLKFTYESITRPSAIKILFGLEIYMLKHLETSKIITKVLGDISSEYDPSTVEKSYWIFSQKNKLEKFYNKVDKVTIDYIKISANSLTNNDYFSPSCDDLVVLALINTFMAIGKKYIEKDINSKYKEYSNLYYYLKSIFKLDYDRKINQKECFCNEFYDQYEVEQKIIKYFFKYIFEGRNKDKKNIRIIDIINNIFNEELNNSTNLKRILYKENLTYKDFDGNLELKVNEYIKRKSENEIKEKLDINVSFNDVDNIDKIYRIISKSKNANVFLANIIYLFYTDNKYINFFISKNITLDMIADYIGISKEEIDKFKELETDYNHILNNINLSDSYDIFIKNNFSKYKEIFMKLIDTEQTEILFKEITSGKEYISKELQLSLYMNKPVPKLDLNKVDDISSFGNLLSEQAEFITKEFADFIESKPIEDTDESIELKNDIRKISTKNDKIKRFTLFSFQKEEESIIPDKKEVFKKLDNFFEKKSKSLTEGLKDLQYIRMAIGVYLSKANEYVESLKETKKLLETEISKKNYVENDYRVFDDNLKMQIINDKISSINMSIIKMLQQYEKIIMQMSTHAALINQINISRSTVLQNVYIEMSLNEGILKEKTSIEALNSLMTLLDQMNLANGTNMVENIDKIQKMNKKKDYEVISDSDKILINEILTEQNLLTDDTSKSK